MKLQVVDLSASQARAFKKAYSAGEVNTEAMFNLFNFMSLPPAYGLQLLTGARLQPAHFSFTGNRPYHMQVVSNGECFAVLSHERVPKSQQDQPAINSVRMEVITRADLPFLNTQEPTERQLRVLYADFIEWTVSRFNQVKASWPPEAIDFSLSMSTLQRHEKDEARDRLLAGDPAREVMAAWIEDGNPKDTLKHATPISRRPSR